MNQQPTVAHGSRAAAPTALAGFPAPGSIPAQHPFPGPHFGPPAGFGAYPPPPPAPKRRRTGLVVGVVLAVLVLLAGLGVGAIWLFGERTLVTDSVEQEIVRITQEQIGIAPTDVVCPADIPVESGASTACTAAVEGQPLTYIVTQTDDRGSLSIDHTRVVPVSEVEALAAAQISAEIGEEVVVVCGTEGQTWLVNDVDAPISCGAANAADPTLAAPVTVYVAADGTVSYEVA